MKLILKKKKFTLMVAMLVNDYSIRFRFKFFSFYKLILGCSLSDSCLFGARIHKLSP